EHGTRDRRERRPRRDASPDREPNAHAGPDAPGRDTVTDRLPDARAPRDGDDASEPQSLRGGVSDDGRVGREARGHRARAREPLDARAPAGGEEPQALAQRRDARGPTPRDVPGPAHVVLVAEPTRPMRFPAIWHHAQ